MATDEELSLIHDSRYVEAVKLAGKGMLPKEKASSYGLGTEDTPIFENMHEASALLVGGTLTAVDEVMTGRSEHALNLGGGLHHGFRGKASGFCIYNDTAVAIKYLQEKYNARVLYVDTDAHHGDGVQWAFYEDQMFVRFPFMRQDDIYSLERAISMNVAKERGMGIPLIFLLTLLQRMIPFLKFTNKH